MKDRILKLSEMIEVDSDVYDNKINIWKAYLFAVTLGFIGYHWIFLKRTKLAFGRIILTVITLITLVLVLLGVIPKMIGTIIFVGLIFTSFVWTTIDMFLINSMSDKNDKENELKATARLKDKKDLERAEGV